MDKLSKEEVLHVANLARLELTDDEVEKFRVQLKELLDEIDKIQTIEVTTNDIMISPNDNECSLTDDVVKDSLKVKEVLKNAPHTYQDYIEVRGGLDD